MHCTSAMLGHVQLWAEQRDSCCGVVVITKKSGNHEIFITKIFNHGIFSNFMKILKHENLELYGSSGTNTILPVQDCPLAPCACADGSGMNFEPVPIIPLCQIYTCTSLCILSIRRPLPFNRLWAIDANWRHIRNVRYRRLTPNGVKAVFFAFFVHSARLLRSTSGLWLAADRRY